MAEKTFYNLRVGMLVRIKEGTHDFAMPESRTGLLMGQQSTLHHYTSTEPSTTNVWRIQFTNGKTLMFHAMYIEVIN